jgi:hypothetical protein
MLFKRNPALFMAGVQALIALVIGFGVHISTEQFGLIMTAVSTAVAFIVRANVYAPVDKDGNPIAVSKA